MRKISPFMKALMAPAIANFANNYLMQSNHELKGIDIMKEAKLVMEKRSDLSARQRDMVMDIYEQMNKEAEEKVKEEANNGQN